MLTARPVEISPKVNHPANCHRPAVEIFCELVFSFRHGEPFRTTTVHRSRRPHSRRQKHALPGDCRNPARPAHQRARAQSLSAAVLRWRAGRGLPGAVRLPHRALRAARQPRHQAQSQQDLRCRLHLRERQAVCLPQPGRRRARGLQPLLRTVSPERARRPTW